MSYIHRYILANNYSYLPGRITYDPYASVDKIKREESKYTRCKQQYGFCIPGYQVYRVGGPRDGELVKAGKEQGKRLCGEQVVTGEDIQGRRKYKHTKLYQKTFLCKTVYIF